jgi:parallel beta-helix repeat protein
LNGFTIQGASGPAANTPVAGIVISGSSPTITNNVIQQNIACGIAVLQNASPTIQGNDIRQNRAPLTQQEPIGSCGAVAGTGLYMYGGNTVTVTENVIEENTVIGGFTAYSESNGAGIVVLATTRLILMNNIVRNNVGYFDDGLQYSDSGADTLLMVQNLFYTDSSASVQSDAGVYVEGAFQSPYPSIIEINNSIYSSEGLQGTYAAGSVIDNNIFDDLSPLSEGGISCIAGAQTAPIAIENNDIVPPTRSLPDEPGGCPLGAANISLDPQFISPTSGNFQVQRTSPVIAAGDITAPMIPAADLAGKNRTVCGRIDMGAYEVHPQPSITVTSSNNPSVGGTAVTFNTQVPGNCNIPTGTVTFLDGTKVLGTVALSAGASASLTTSSLTVGTHTITVTYPGDFNFDASTSAPLTQVVTGFPTSTTLSVSPNPAGAFAPIQLSSTVSSQFGKPTGSVSFTTGTTTLATVPLSGSGNASVTISTLGAGIYNIIATYSADTNFAASSSLVLIEKVIGADSTVTLTGSPNPATYGQTVIFKAIVRPVQGNAVPTGSVLFSDGGTTLASVQLDATGAASLNNSTLSIGTHPITASYSGSGNFDPSSATINETITAITTKLALTASPNPAALGQPVTIVATATAIGSQQIPSGTVTFFDGSTVLGTALLGASGQASIAISTLALGTHTLTASYPSGTSFGNSTSPPIQETILASSFTVTLGPSTITIHPGQQGSVAVQLSSVGLFSGPLTLSYGALPEYASASLSSSSVSLTQGGTGTATLTLNTAAKTASAFNQSPSRPGARIVPSIFAASVVLLLPFGAIRRKRLAQLFYLLLTGLMIQGLAGCANRYYEVNLVTQGTYQVPITATDSNQVSATSNLTVVVVP